MANWALVVGINQYSRLQSLSYSVSDAEAIVNYFSKEAGFEQIFYFSDDSPDFNAPDGSTIESQPTYANLWSFLFDFFEEDRDTPLKPGDNFWFFFSGHGIRHEDRDYLMPRDANPRAIERTAIPVNYVSDRLRRSGADNVILFLDACRSQGDRAGLGIGMERQQGVITICACSPKEKSYEIEELGQGSFTYSLLEALRIKGENNCATVERLYQRLRYRVPLINENYQKPLQTPYVITEPASKLHLILLPRQATLADIALLKNDAWRAEAKSDWQLAKQLWIRVNVAAGGSDMDAIEAIQRFPQWTQQESTHRPKTADETGAKSDFKNSESSQTDTAEVELLSEKGIDYAHLRDLLAAGKWREADEETAKKMLEVAGQRDWLDIEDIDNFPCSDLRTIDRLWVKYSDGRFGFSVQARIYRELGGTRDYDSKTWEAFGDRVGWRSQGEWMSYKSLTYRNTAPRAHLPLYLVRTNHMVWEDYFGGMEDAVEGSGYPWGMSFGGGSLLSGIFSRLRLASG
ncbi:MAG: hypothetical protein F6J93_26120 [Oscillatoria sp. SIO1A7]|nr:hypothetical protein [Oscillatoria sp. SIO1A7]